MLRLVLLGPPGCGKGTQAALLCAREGILHLSTGDLLRAAVAAGSDLGKRAKPLMDAGRLVPDDLVIGLVSERIARPDAKSGFLLDGFPRTIPQAEALERALASERLSAVVSYVLGDEEIVRRSLGRGRSDDAEPVVRKRLQVYRAQTEPLVAWYRSKGILEEVDASGTVSEVQEDTTRAVERRKAAVPSRGSPKAGAGR